MAITKRTVNYLIKDTEGDPVPHARLLFELVADSIQAGAETLVGAPTASKADKNGVGAVELAAPDSGSVEYTVKYANGTKDSFYLSAGAAVDLSTLIDNYDLLIPEDPNTFQTQLTANAAAIVAAQAAADAAQADADTNAANISTNAANISTNATDITGKLDKAGGTMTGGLTLANTGTTLGVGNTLVGLGRLGSSLLLNHFDQVSFYNTNLAQSVAQIDELGIHPAKYTNAGRPTPTGTARTFIWNSDIEDPQIWDGVGWRQIGRPALGEAITAGQAGEKAVLGKFSSAMAGEYVVIDPRSGVAEIAKISSGGNVEPAGATYARTHAIGAEIEALKNNAIDMRHYGIGPNETEANNAIRLQRFLNEVGGLLKTTGPPGTIAYDTTLAIPDSGWYFAGSGASDDGTPTTLRYTGAGVAIEQAITADTGHHKLRLEDFILELTSSATYGIDFQQASYYVLILNNIEIQGGTGAGAYAGRLQNIYNGSLSNISIENCTNGLLLDGVQAGTNINQIWIRGASFTGIGIHSNPSSGGVSVDGAIIGNSVAQPATQKGIYVQAGYFEGTRIHLEDLYQPFDIESGPTWLGITSLGSYTADWNVDPGVDFGFHRGSRVGLSAANWVQPGLGTKWDFVQGNIIAPVSSDQGNITAWSPVIQIDGTGAYTLHGMGGDPGRESGNLMTLYFLRSDTTVAHMGIGGGYEFKLKGDSDWTPPAGSVLHLAKIIDDDTSTWHWYEVGRYDALHWGKSITANYTIQEADGGKTLGNKGATGTVRLTLPNVTQVPIGWEITVARTENQLVQVAPFSTNRIRGADIGTGAATKAVELSNLETITLINMRQDTYWEVKSVTGSPTFEA